MIDNLEALAALARHGTMMEAATALRITQSAVSKRIAGLERHYNHKLIQKRGRRVELTRHGRRLADKVGPILSELRGIFIDEQVAAGEVIIGVSEAILSSWGAAVFREVADDLSEVHFVFHTHRTPVVLDRVRSGEFMVGVCTGTSDLDTDLQSEILCQEPMVIIPSALEPLDYSPMQELDVISIEDYSGAWRSFREDVQRLGIRREVALESFFGVAQMAIAGFGHGLVPAGVARTLGVPQERFVDLGPSGLTRPVRFVARKSTYALPAVARFYRALVRRIASRPLSAPTDQG